MALFTNDKDDFGARPGGIKHLIFLDELRCFWQVWVTLDGELVNWGEALISPVGEVGAVGQNWNGEHMADGLLKDSTV